MPTLHSRKLITLIFSQQAGHSDFVSQYLNRGSDVNSYFIAFNMLDPVVGDGDNAEALAGVEPMVQGLATNGAWAQVDPDQMVTYGLMADYAVGQTEEAMAEVEAAFTAPPAPPAPPAKPAKT